MSGASDVDPSEISEEYGWDFLDLLSYLEEGGSGSPVLNVSAMQAAAEILNAFIGDQTVRNGTVIKDEDEYPML